MNWNFCTEPFRMSSLKEGSVVVVGTKKKGRKDADVAGREQTWEGKKH
jgi:hypothetical protein